MEEYQKQVVQAFEKVLSGDKTFMDQGTLFIQENTLSNEYSQALMMLIDNEQLNLNLRQFALTQLQQVVEKYWKGEKKIGEEAKQLIRTSIIPALIRVSSIPKLYKTYAKIIYNITQMDFPKEWPNCVDQIVKELKESSDFYNLFGVLNALKSIVSVFEYQLGDEDRKPLEDVINVTFPHLQDLIVKIWDNYGEQTAYLLQIILRIFYICINLEMPVYFKDQYEKLKNWIDIFGILYEREIPEEFTKNPTSDEQIQKLNKSIFWKNKKQVGKLLMKFIQKYSNKNFETANTKGLSQYYGSQYGTKFIDMMMKKLKLSQTQFVSMPTLHYSMRYLQMSLRLSELAQYMTPNLTNLAIDICVPLLVMSQKDQKLFIVDPIEFMRKEEDFQQTCYNPKNASMDLIETIARQNDGKHLFEIMQFFHQCLTTNQFKGQPLSIEQKDGIFWALGELQPIIIKYDQISSQIEGMLQAFVFPQFNQPEPYIRSRTCWLFGVYGYINYQNQDLVSEVTKCLCKSILDQNLVVKSKAAIALNKFLHQEISKKIVQQEIKNLVGIYLKLMEDVDSESLVNALEGIISNFKDEIKGFSVSLIGSLIEAFYRYDEKEQEEEEAYGEGEFAAAGCLEAINKILASDLDQAIYTNIEQQLLAVMYKTITDESEYIEEGLDMIAIFVQKCPKLSSNMYFFYVALNYLIATIPENLVVQTIPNLNEDQMSIMEGCKNGWGIEFLYKMMPTFKNFIKKDLSILLEEKDFFGKSLIDLMFNVVDFAISESAKTEEFSEMISALDYFIAFTENCADQKLNLQNKIPQMNEINNKIVQVTLKYLNQYGKQDVKFSRKCYVVISTVMIYDINMVLQLLEQNNITTVFLEHMLESIIQNKKLKNNNEFQLQKLMMGLTQILTIDKQNIPQSVLGQFAKLMSVFVFLSKMILDIRMVDEEDDDDDNDDDLDFMGTVEYDDKYDTPFDCRDELIEFEKQFNIIKNKDITMFNELLSLLSMDQQKQLNNNLIEANKQYVEFMQQQQNNQ